MRTIRYKWIVLTTTDRKFLQFYTFSKWTEPDRWGELLNMHVKHMRRERVSGAKVAQVNRLSIKTVTSHTVVDSLGIPEVAY